MPDQPHAPESRPDTTRASSGSRSAPGSEPEGWQGLDPAPEPIGDPLTGPMPPEFGGQPVAPPPASPQSPSRPTENGASFAPPQPAPLPVRTPASGTASAQATSPTVGPPPGWAPPSSGRPVSGPPLAAPPPAPVTRTPAETGQQTADSSSGGSVQRFMTATDFLDRRADQVEHGPAAWGWRGRVRRWTGGTISPKMGPAELQYEQDRRAIQRDFDGPRTIAFLNPKGGAAKTTGVLAAGYTFGTVRGGGVVAWDNNETRGTLGIRGHRSSHRNTTRELLEDLERFNDVYQARIGDLGAFVRSQGDAHFDILASDERPHVTGMIRAQDFTAVHQLLERFYRLILVDTGNNMRAENWLAAAEAADLLVVTSTIREDTGYSGLWMLDALQDAGYQNLKHKSITVLSDPSSHVDEQLAGDLVQVYEQRTKAVFRVPYDPVLVSGSVVPYAQLSDETRMAWLRACAAMAVVL
jgi:MinD-like ATPase involved in chromosome partitioning or flagellar assembly